MEPTDSRVIHGELLKLNTSGFTLVEMMIVIVVMAIAFSLAIPSFNGMIQRNRIAVQVNDFLLAVNFARSEAMRRGSQVTVQSADNGAESANEFGNGYCVQIGAPGDSGFSTSCTYSAGRCSPIQMAGCVLRDFEPLTGTSSLDSEENSSAITFGSLGELSANTVQNLDMCDSRGLADGRRIVVSLIGRSRSYNNDALTPPTC